MKQRDIELTIDYVGRRGDGVGAFEGKPVFVPRALAGETVQVKLLESRDKGYAARLLQVVSPSADRIAAPCPHYDKCGGCSLQHWQGYEGWKAERSLELLEKAGVLAEQVKPTIYIPAGTRRRATLAAHKQNGKVHLGYHRARSHDIVNIPNCLILTPRLQVLIEAIRPYLVAILADNKPADIFVQDTGDVLDVMITGPVASGKKFNLAVREAMGDMVRECNIARLSWRAKDTDEPELILQPAPVIKKSGLLSVELPPGAFMQPSAEGEAALVAAILEPIKAAGSKNIADLFAGCGTFTGPLLQYGTIYAAESDRASVQALQKASAGITQLNTAYRNLFSDPLTEKELNEFDAVIMDPPRMGAKEQAETFAWSDVKLIVSVSCNPTTFVRDAKTLIEGGYKFRSVQIIDQFTYSSHVELVGVFAR